MRRALLVLLLIFGLSPAVAFGDAREDAEKSMEQGAGFFKKKKYSKALAAYQEALRAFPEAPGPYREIAKCLVKLGKRDEAIHNLTEYLRLRPEAPEREEIVQGIIELRAKLPSKGKAALSLDSDPPGAVVYVLDAEGNSFGIGLTPIEGHPVEPSRVAVRLSRPYYEEKEEKLALSPDSEISLSLKLTPAGLEKEEVIEEPPQKATGFLIASGALGVSAVAVGALFLQDRADFKLLPSGDPDAPGLQKKLFIEAGIADGLVLAALVTGGIGAWRLLKGRKARKKSPAEEKSVSLNLSPAPNGLLLSGRF